MKNIFLMVIFIALLLPTTFYYASSQSNPTALVPDIQIGSVINVPAYCSRIALDPITKDLYYTVLSGEIHRVTITAPVLKDTLLFDYNNHHIDFLQGLVFYDSTLYLVGDVIPNTNETRGMVVRGKLQPNGERLWDTVAMTELYPSGNTAFDHGYSGITINPTGDSLFINSGSRTDHGEEQNNDSLFPGTREVPLTSAIFRISSSSHNLFLQNDSAALSPYLYVDGVRNSFDLAFASDGRLFALENSGDRDDPDEMNWIRKGHHYGFPWILGGDYNPQQFPNYNPDSDIMLSKNRPTYKKGYYHNDPAYPPFPSGLVVTPGILNLGPDADFYRDSTSGIIYQAGDNGHPLRSFTPHRAPVGLVFDYDSIFAQPFNGSAFMLGFQNQADSNGIAPDSTNGTLLDPSEDMVQLQLIYDAAEINYKMVATRIIQGFTHPVDACVVDTSIYVIEYSKNSTASIWKITFSKIPLPDTTENPLPLTIFPNPAQSTATVSFSLNKPGDVQVEVFDVLGKQVMNMGNHFEVSGNNSFSFPVKQLNEGYYFLVLRFDEGSSAYKLLVMGKD